MPDAPQAAGTAPIKIAVEAGKSYWWCACGKSASQPFCDGSHKGTGLSPTEYVAVASEDVWFCACKRTASQPTCDGSHKALR